MYGKYLCAYIFVIITENQGDNMLTYSFENRGDDTLYEYLYKQIKNDIINRKLLPGEKLPSKRIFAKNLGVSTITVENAYSQLVSEGYIYALPKSGYYVNEIDVYSYDYRSQTKTEKKLEGSAVNERNINTNNGNISKKQKVQNTEAFFADFVSNSTAEDAFPFSVWTRLLREIMAEDGEKLMTRSQAAGVPELRKAVADYLYQFRGMEVDADQIIIGAGTEYLYGLIIQILGYDRCYAVEDPGYQKISQIYNAHNVSCKFIDMDDCGVNIEALEKSGADVIHISPSHHFPTGLVTPVSRRYELLSWASRSHRHYIIEDEYDSEFRLQGRPIPTLESIDVSEKVIYINTFSKSLASTIRISYMVLPKHLMEIYNNHLGFYACTVSNFEQYTLARFITGGYLEKHINRMRNYYRGQRDKLLECIKQYTRNKNILVKEENAGLHFLLEVDTNYSDQQLIENAAQNGIHISCLSQYYKNLENAKQHTFIINYSGISPDNIEESIKLLIDSI
jgi:GntR family transcriptional regulator/MocR family aminotransferase